MTNTPDLETIAIHDREKRIAAIAHVVCRTQANYNGHSVMVLPYHAHIATAIVDKDAISLEHILMTPDASMRKAFEFVTNIKLDPSYKRAWAKLRAWGGLSDQWQAVRDASWAANSVFDALGLHAKTSADLKDEVRHAFDRGYSEIVALDGLYRLAKPGSAVFWALDGSDVDISAYRSWIKAYAKFRVAQLKFQAEEDGADQEKSAA